ncbi:MAG TPA: NfeD family protein [Spirochaetota bacterium]|nr:NfeD family protein [Spirochaetota bacterium]HPJ35527.1 NfeD family protein [Spirochaetota bacterium]
MLMTPLMWLALGAVLMALEIVAPGFIIFWFGLGAALTALLSFTGVVESEMIQWLVFFSSSILFLGLWFGFLRKKFRPGSDDDQRDPTLYHLRGKCMSRIEPGKPGEVELYEHYHGITRWKAESSEVIELNDEIQVLEASGIKLIVKKDEGRF